MQGADEGEQTARRVAVDADLALEALYQNAAALVVQATAPHVDGLNARRRRGADGLVVALADDEVVFDDTPQRRQREHHREWLPPSLLGNGQDEAVLDKPQ